MPIEPPLWLRPEDVCGDILLDAASDGLLVVDVDADRVIVSNAAAARVIGLSREEIEETPASKLLPSGETPEAAGPAASPDALGVAGHVHVTRGVTRRVKGRRVEVVTVREGGGATEAERLRAANARLGAMNRDLQEFSHTVTHDLMEPLRGIEALSGILLMDEAGLSPEGRDVAERLQANATRLKGMVRRVLEISRSTQQDEHFADVHAAQAIEGVLARLANHLEARDARVTLRGFPMPPIRTFPVAFDQVVQNLVSNAVKHGPKGVHVVVSAEDVGSEWRFSVEDDGPGIPPEKRVGLFDLFQRGATTADGSGIGLSTVRAFVTRMGGRVGACDASELSGACFWFTVPKEPPTV